MKPYTQLKTSQGEREIMQRLAKHFELDYSENKTEKGHSITIG